MKRQKPAFVNRRCVGVSSSLDFVNRRCTGKLVPLDQDRISEFMCSIVAGLQLEACLLERRVISECAKQFVVARSGLVGTGKNHIDNSERGRMSDSLSRQPFAPTHRTARAGRMFECADDSGTDRDNAAAAGPCLIYGCGS